MSGPADETAPGVLPIEILNDPAYTPGRKQVASLVESIAHGDDEVSRAAARALARVQSPVVGKVIAGLRAAHAPSARAKLADALRVLVGRGEDEAIVEALEQAVEDPEPRVRRTAARGLGKIGGERAERALARAAEGEADASATRAIERARAPLRRDATRAEPSEIAEGAALPERTAVVFRCRRGLEETLEEEIRERLGLAAERRAEESVTVRTRAPLAELYRVRTALSVSLSFAAARIAGDPVEDAVALLSSPEVISALRALTRGPVRYRLSWSTGKRRAQTSSVTRGVADRTGGELLDDPRASAWTVLVSDDGSQALFTPRAPDPRFAYRVADVPAASHPTIAAALAREAGVRPNDVVWDPFVGSGLELCERALLGPYRRLIGTDVDARAVERARANLTGAGATSFDLELRDARRASFPGTTLVITNPPMGRRLVRGPALDELLAETMQNAARCLAPGGRVVLLSPRPRVTREALESSGVALAAERPVDLGGFEAVLQRFERSATAAGRRGARAART